MKKEHKFPARRVRTLLRAKAFCKRNGIYIAIIACLAVLGGTLALLPGPADRGSGNEAPAGNSHDQRLSEAETALTPPARPTPRAIPTFAPVRSGEPTPVPTVLPELTPSPSREPEPSAPSKYNSPVDGRLIRSYAMDSLIYSKTLDQWMTHSGVDIAAPKGREVRAIAPGVVERVYDDDMYGTSVLIDHGNGLKTLYCGLKKEPPVSEGDKLGDRALIGNIGDTAISECAEESHLHFEVIRDGLPVDPEGYVLIANEG